MICVNLDTTPTLLVEAISPYNVAVINLIVVNYGDTPASFTIYAVPHGKSLPEFDSNGNLVSGNLETHLLVDQKIQPKDTIFFNFEKFLLHGGDALYAKKNSDTDQIAIHVVYETY